VTVDSSVIIAIAGWVITFVSVFATLKADVKNLHETFEKDFKNISDDIKRLEEKQDKYNGVKDRMIKVEMSSKSNQKRIDKMESKIDHIFNYITREESLKK